MGTYGWAMLETQESLQALSFLEVPVSWPLGNTYLSEVSGMITSASVEKVMTEIRIFGLGTKHKH